MNTCKNCKHWERETYQDVAQPHGYCHLFSRGGESPGKDAASAYDNFWTGEDFFCARLEAGVYVAPPIDNTPVYM